VVSVKRDIYITFYKIIKVPKLIKELLYDIELILTLNFLNNNKSIINSTRLRK